MSRQTAWNSCEKGKGKKGISLRNCDLPVEQMGLVCVLRYVYVSLIRLWVFEGQWFLVAHLLLCSSVSAEHDAWQSVGAEQNWVRMNTLVLRVGFC